MNQWNKILLTMALVGACLELLLLHPRIDHGTLKTPQGTSAIQIPFTSHDPFINQSFTVNVSYFKSLLTTSAIRIIPDDCLVSIRVNSIPIDLSSFSHSALCDYTHGVRVDFRRQLHFGSNEIEFQFQNLQGDWGVKLDTTTAPKTGWFLVLVAGLLSFLLIQELLKYLPHSWRNEFRRSPALAPLIIFVIGYFTYFHRYWEPAALFWDENYYIPCVQKYLHRVYFLHDHPPFGKFLITLGEWLLHPNVRTDQFLTTEYGRNVSPEFSLVGVRLFPALLGWWSTVVFYFILFGITRNRTTAFLLSSLYLFDNALIVHFRGAMIDGPLIFLVLLLVLCGLQVYRARHSQKRFIQWTLGASILIGLLITTKQIGVIGILMAPILFLLALKTHGFRLAFKTLLAVSVPAILTWALVWQVHFWLGGKSILDFPAEIGHSYEHMNHYHEGVPSLNVCKVGENGSPFYFWPLGGRAIDYRRETQDGFYWRYLFLQVNPIHCLVGFLGVVLSFILCFGSFFYSIDFRRSRRFLLVGVFFLAYSCYMIAISEISRVMYLYHYFIPLLFSYFLFAAVWVDLPRVGPLILTKVRKSKLLAMMSWFSFLFFIIYAPLTYYQPLSQGELGLRALLNIWDLKCFNCENTNELFRALH